MILAAFTAAGAVGALGVLGHEPAAREPSSQTALELAETLRGTAAALDYDDPRLAATAGFTPPDPSLLPSTPGYLHFWKIVEHAPARYMKTIEIRIRWSRPGPDGELVVSAVKAS